MHSLHEVQNQQQFQLPLSLVTAVFEAEEYLLDSQQQNNQIKVLYKSFLLLPPIQQALLSAYYQKGVSQKSLAELYGISTKQCSKLLHRSLHQLRKSTNPLYRAAIDRIHLY